MCKMGIEHIRIFKLICLLNCLLYFLLVLLIWLPIGLPIGFRHCVIPPLCHSARLRRRDAVVGLLRRWAHSRKKRKRCGAVPSRNH